MFPFLKKKKIENFEKIITDLPTKNAQEQMALHVNSTKQLRDKNHKSYTNLFKEGQKNIKYALY